MQTTLQNNRLKKQYDWEYIKKRFGWNAQLCSVEEQSFIGEAISLLRSQYEYADECYPEYFDWEYIKNPAGKPVIWVAKSRNEIIGMFIANRIQFKVNGELKQGSIAVKNLVRKDYRGKGIYIYLGNKNLETCNNQGIDFTFGFPNKNSYKACLERLGFIDIGEVPFLIKPISAGGFIKRKVKNKFVNVFMCSFLWAFLLGIKASYAFREVFFMIPGKHDKVRIKEIKRFDEKINIFWEKAQKKYQNIAVRDMSALNWKYCDNPRRYYRIFVAENKNGEIIAYGIGRVATINGIKIGAIVDVLSLDDKLAYDGAFLVIKHLLKYFETSSVEFAACLMLADKKYFKLLKKSYFFVCPKKIKPHLFRFVIKIHNDSISNGEGFALKKWFVTLGDYDVL